MSSFFVVVEREREKLFLVVMCRRENERERNTHIEKFNYIMIMFGLVT